MIKTDDLDDTVLWEPSLSTSQHAFVSVPLRFQHGNDLPFRETELTAHLAFVGSDRSGTGTRISAKASMKARVIRT